MIYHYCLCLDYTIYDYIMLFDFMYISSKHSVVVILMIALAFNVVVHICDGGLDFHIICTTAHIVHVVRDFDDSGRSVSRSINFVS